MLLRNILLLTGLLAVSGLPAQDDHFFRCLSVQDNRDVQLVWIASSNTDFINYEIYHSNTLSTSFTLIETIDDNTVASYLHTDQSPANLNNFYFIKINLSGASAIISDTIQAIKLRLIPQSDNSIARLDWNRPHSPPLPSSESKFTIYRKYTYGNWIPIAETSGILLIDTIQVCPDSINYRIELANASGCISVSNVAGAWLEDLTQPPEPILDSAGTDFSGNALLGWQMSKDSGTAGYIIYRNQAGIWPPLDTVVGLNTTHYTDSTANACFRNRSYGIAAIDSCGNTSGRGIGPENKNDSLRTILLKPIDFDPCQKTAKLNWTSYINMFPQLSGYKIYYSKDGVDFELLSTIDSSENTFTHSNLEPFSNYRYFVRAFNTDKTSTSCMQSVNTYYPKLPAYLYLRTATVNQNDNIKLIVYTDSSVFVTGYQVLRSENESGPFEPIDTLQPETYANISFYDLQANFDQQSYYYKLQVLDSCGSKGIESNIGRTILLSIDSPSNEENQLNWNPYETWDGEIEKYDIYRRDEASANPVLITSVSSGITSYTDNISGINQTTANFSYFVEAIETKGINYAFRDTSRSNEAIARQSSEIFVPNAFAPKGTNSIFKPVFRFIESADYSLRIYDRWGDMVFESHDPGKGWNGIRSGNYVPPGVYVYVIIFKDASGSLQTKKGTVAVIY